MRASARTVLAVLGLAGVLTPFLPFAYKVSPLGVFIDYHQHLALMLVAAPFFLAFFISLGALRVGFPSKAETVAAWVLSIGLSAAMLIHWGKEFLRGLQTSLGWNAEESAALAVWLLSIAALTVLVVWLLRHRNPSMAALIAMQGAYSANALFCLICFWSGLESGAALAAVTILLYASHAALLASLPGVDFRAGERPTGA